MISKYFSIDEVKCRCPDNCGEVPGDMIMAIADELREGWGSGVTVTSGARCHNYNEYLRMHGIKAAKYSAHIEGIALDLRPVNGEIKKFQDYVRSRLVDLEIRMESPIDAPQWAHVDLRPVQLGMPRIFRA